MNHERDLGIFIESLKNILKQEYAVIFSKANLPAPTPVLMEGRFFRSGLAFTVSSLMSPQTLTQACIALELAHTATLIHDDVIDRAETRRGQDSISKTFGQDVAILLGNLVTERSHQIAIELSPTFARRLADALGRVNTAQILEYLSRGKRGRSVDEYLEVCLGKTSAMLELAIHAGVISDGITEPQIHLLKAAENVGLAFQIIDDCEDFEISMTGYEFRSKHGTQDLDLANYTLPLILAEQSSDPNSDSVETNWEIHLSQAMNIGQRYLDLAKEAAESSTPMGHLEITRLDRVLRWLDRVNDSLYSHNLDQTLQNLKTGD